MHTKNMQNQQLDQNPKCNDTCKKQKTCKVKVPATNIEISKSRWQECNIFCRSILAMISGRFKNNNQSKPNLSPRSPKRKQNWVIELLNDQQM